MALSTCRQAQPHHHADRTDRLGTFLTNLYLITTLNPDKVVAGFKANNVSSWFQQNPAKDESIFVHALLRAASSDPHTCMQTTGAEIALHVNTMYMFVSISPQFSA